MNLNIGEGCSAAGVESEYRHALPKELDPGASAAHALVAAMKSQGISGAIRDIDGFRVEVTKLKPAEGNPAGTLGVKADASRLTRDLPPPFDSQEEAQRAATVHRYANRAEYDDALERLCDYGAGVAPAPGSCIDFNAAQWAGSAKTGMLGIGTGHAVDGGGSHVIGAQTCIRAFPDRERYRKWFVTKVLVMPAPKPSALDEMAAQEAEPATGDDAHRDVPFRFHPRTGIRLLAPSHHTRRTSSFKTWEFNPWTGVERLREDVEADPQGLTLRPPGWPVFAASKPSAFDEMAAQAASWQGNRAVGASPALGAPYTVGVDPAHGPDTMAYSLRGLKPSNPKDAVGDTKVPLALCSPIAKAHWALAQHCGRVKYGAWNWREAGARISVYLSAIQRHADAYLSGERLDPADGTHHLGNIMACCAILLDAEAAGKLTDDRPPEVGMRCAYAEVERQQAELTKKYSDRNPKHWTR